jgi:methylmalonyl-CoA mutase cobalamin-binding domain/chain
MDETGTAKAVQSHLAAGDKASDIFGALSAGMNIVGKKYAEHEFFLADLVMAAEIFQETMQTLEPAMLKEGGPGKKVAGRIVIGTVQGDLHDIGKNIFVAMARNAGFQVNDLGIDVPPAKLVEAVKADHADVLGLSGIMTMSLEPMAESVKLLKQAGLRDKVKVILGGLPVDERWRELTGADAASDDAYKGLKIIESWVEGK